MGKRTLQLIVLIVSLGISLNYAYAANTAPTVDAGLDITINEGDTFSVTGSFTDPDADEWTATVDYGDGSGSQTLSLNANKTFSLSHVYAQDSDLINGGPFTVTVTVNDGVDSGVDTVLVTVNNVLPTISSISDVTINQGDTLVVTGNFSDPGNDAWIANINWGGTDFEDVPLNTDKTFELDHNFTKAGVFNVTLTISDGPASESTEEFIVTVNNVNPILTLESGQDTINEGDEFSASGSFNDPGQDPWTITADYGDNTGSFNIGFESDKTFKLQHVYENEGVFTVTVTIDDGIATDIKTLDVTVNNVVPTVDAGPDKTINEGEDFVSMGSFTDSGSDIHTVTVDYGDATIPQTISANPDGTFDLNHTYSRDGTFIVTVTVNDGTSSSSDTASVTVNNVAPTVSITEQSIDENRSFTASGSFTDPGDDTWTATVDYGDGSGSQPLSLNADKTFSLSHTYATNSAYLVTVTVNDGLATGVSPFTVGVFVSTSGPGAGLISPPDSFFSLNEPATFTTTNQDIWSPVTGGSGTSSWELFTPQTWDERDGDSDFVTLAGKKLGGGIDAGTNGHLKLTASASNLNGKIGVDYPGTLTIESLNANTFLAGESVPIKGIWTIDSARAKINAQQTKGDLRLDLDLGLKAFVDTEVCLLVGCFDPFLIPDIDFDMHPGNTKLFSFTQAGLDIPSALTGFAGFGGNFNPIMVQPSTTVVSPTGTLTAETTDTFSHIDIDIDNVASRLGIAPPLDVSKSAGKVGFSYTVFDADANIDFKAHQKLIFDTDILVKLDFDTPVDGITGSVVDVTTNGAGKVTSATYRAGEQINVIFPQDQTDPITVTPTVFVDSPRLTHFTELITKSFVTMEALETSLRVDGFTVIPAIPIYSPFPHLADWECHGFACLKGHFHHREFHKIDEIPAVRFNGIDFSVGPAWDSGPEGEVSREDTIADTTFTLGGFNTVKLASFELDPEVPPTAVIGGPYVVDEGSTITLDGSASFDVDIPPQTLTYSWDLDNDGTFETRGVTVEFTQTADGPQTYLISLQVCDEYNCDVDTGEVQVLNVPPTVDAGSDQEVVIHDLVSLDPSTFSDPGYDCSECGTSEDFTASVNWGEGTNESLIVNEIPGSAGVLTNGTASGNHIYRLPGNYTVTVTVTDDDSASTSDTLITTVLGAQDLKNRVISILLPFESDSKEVKKAIESIQESLDPKLWIDVVNLDKKHGNKVFDEEKNAVKKLEKIIKPDDDDKEEKKKPSPELQAAVQKSIDILVNADRVLAITSMLEADSTPVDDPKDQKKVDKEKDKASEEFAEGDASRDAGKPDKAIDHYKKAWKHSQHAVKHALGIDDDSDDKDESNGKQEKDKDKNDK